CLPQEQPVSRHVVITDRGAVSRVQFQPQHAPGLRVTQRMDKANRNLADLIARHLKAEAVLEVHEVDEELLEKRAYGSPRIEVHEVSGSESVSYITAGSRHLPACHHGYLMPRGNNADAATVLSVRMPRECAEPAGLE